MSYESDKKFIEQEILKKNDLSRAYFATNQTINNVQTDMNSFPYIRWYRGQYANSAPVIIDREAGYQKVSQFKNVVESYYVGGYPLGFSQGSSVDPKERPNQPNFCWEGPCSTVLPCYSDTKKDYKEAKIALKTNSLNVSI